jgi:TPR repeat protein
MERAANHFNLFVIHRVGSFYSKWRWSKMTLIMEKLSRYWQLRFVVVGAGIALIVYAVLLPDPGNKSRDTSIQSVAAAPSANAAETGTDRKPVMAEPVSTPPASGSPAATTNFPWMGENRDAVNQLQLAAAREGDSQLPVDFSESARNLRAAAEKGDVVAQFLIGHAYQVGLGVPKDMSETSRWYALAAQPRTTDGSAQLEVKDFAQAFDVYRKLAGQGDENAELYLGVVNDLGQDVPRNASEAAHWYREAAAQGSGSAANNLGILFFNGDGVPKDDAEAARWFRTGANRGCASAQFNLGKLYRDGDGVDRSDIDAAAWLERAAIQGSAPAQTLLSLMYASGQGVAGSTPRAYMWINLASAQDAEARQAREQIEKVMPLEEVAEGQRLTHEWQAQHQSLR